MEDLKIKKRGRPKIYNDEEKVKEAYMKNLESAKERSKKINEENKKKNAEYIDKLKEKYPTSRVKATSNGITVNISMEDLSKL